MSFRLSLGKQGRQKLFLVIFYISLFHHETPRTAHTVIMKPKWKKMLEEPEIRKSLVISIAFVIYMINAVFFCCRALRPCDKGYAPSDLQYLSDRLQCCDPIACAVAALDGVILLAAFLYGIHKLAKKDYSLKGKKQ